MDTYLTYYCEGCDHYHHGDRGVCPICGKGNRIAGFNINPVKTARILGNYQSEDKFVSRCLLKGIGWFNEEWTNEEVMRVFWRRCEEVEYN